MAKMLVVEDDPAWRALYRMTFEQQFEVFEAHDGEDGLSLVESVHPDVIVLDLRMPRMDGISFVKSLRGRGVVPPIVVCSGLLEPGEAPRLPGVRITSKTPDLRGVWTALKEALPSSATPVAEAPPLRDPWRD